MGTRATLKAFWDRRKRPSARASVIAGLVVAIVGTTLGLFLSNGYRSSPLVTRTHTDTGSAPVESVPLPTTAHGAPGTTASPTGLQPTPATVTTSPTKASAASPPSGPVTPIATVPSTVAARAATWRLAASGIPPQPSTTSDLEVAYDPAIKADILLDHGATWTWNGWSWTQLHPSTSPPPRAQAAMAYDSATREIVLFGGEAPDGSGYLGDTWTWDGANWTQRSQSQPPPPESCASIADDPATGQPVLFGGINISNQSFDYGYSSQTWAWDGNAWQLKAPVTSPPARGCGSAAYDPATRDVVLFGGVCTCSGPYGDTWAWNGADWAEQAPPSSPPSSYGTPMIYDSALGGLLLITATEQTWIWSSGRWTQQHPVNSPPYEVGIGAQDPVTGEALVVGGSGQERTWIYNKSSP